MTKTACDPTLALRCQYGKTMAQAVEQKDRGAVQTLLLKHPESIHARNVTPRAYS